LSLTLFRRLKALPLVASMCDDQETLTHRNMLAVCD